MRRGAVAALSGGGRRGGAGRDWLPPGEMRNPLQALGAERCTACLETGLHCVQTKPRMASTDSSGGSTTSQAMRGLVVSGTRKGLTTPWILGPDRREKTTMARGLGLGASK